MHRLVGSLYVRTPLCYAPIFLIPLLLFIGSFLAFSFLLSIVIMMVMEGYDSWKFFSCVDGLLLSQSWLWCSWIYLLVLLMHFPCWSSSSLLIVIVMLMTSCLGAIDTFFVLILLFTTNGDHDDWKLLSWCYWRIWFIWIWSSPCPFSPPMYS